MWVKLSSIIINGHVDQCLVDETDKLTIIWGVDDLNTHKSTVGNDTGTVAVFGTPGNFFAFSVADG